MTEATSEAAIGRPDRAFPPQAPDPAHEALARRYLATLTLEEKLAQIVGYWGEQSGQAVAPVTGSNGEVAADSVAHDDGAEPSGPVAPVAADRTSTGDGNEALREFSRDGLGQLTRVYGTRPVDAAARLRWLRETQRWFVEHTRPRIPALVHEECLTGLTTWGATTFPTPLAWGASFDAEAIEQMGAAIGATMRSLGVHQGLAPVLDVIRDARWGRVEECIAEDPLLVGTLGTAYVRGLQSTGITATLKHFVGYSASRAGRNLAPVHAGPRELSDVLLIPFEMAVRDGGARSVMHSYAEIDGIPAASDRRLLTDLLRKQWGFGGTVVADYGGVEFLHSLHRVAATLTEAAMAALVAGVDVELPTGQAYLAPLAKAVRAGVLDEALVDRAVLRHLLDKAHHGLLSDDFDPDAIGDDPDTIDLDPPEHRALARKIAEESVVLLANNGVLPLRPGKRIALIGPNADRSRALFGCYAFVNHVLDQYPGIGLGIEAPTVLEALQAGADVRYVPGCAVDDDDRSGFPTAVQAAAESDIAIVVAGDQAGLFGRGTVGEGCDRDDLELPGVQRELVESIIGTGTPVVLVLMTGRPYAVGWAAKNCAAIVQAFFPGEEGGRAVADVLTGAVNPSGHLPVSIPRSVGAQPYSYLHPPLGGDSHVSNLSTDPAFPFGHGLSYTSFEYTGLTVEEESPTAGTITATVQVRNCGDRAGDDVVQLYAHDLFASVTRPVTQLVGFARVSVDAGASATVRFDIPTTRLALTDRQLRRVVEPGDVDLCVGPDSATPQITARIRLVGPVHEVTADDARLVRVCELPSKP